ncbi:MAG: hypothetical protein KDC92_08835 [Bacteroidetes bacterium]|nr:hypothetical protein [Bacteroidota bacterium]
MFYYILFGVLALAFLSAAGVFSYKWNVARKKRKAFSAFMKKMEYDQIGYA